MKIAVIGAGFSGLASAYHLLKNFPASLTFFDPLGVGGGASGIAAGLLHIYTGLHCKLNDKGQEGYSATYELLEAASLKNETPVFERSGLIRIATTDLAIREYNLCAEKYPDVHKLSADEVTALAPGASYRPGIFIESALTVYTDAYLQGLWKICQSKGCILETQRIQSLEELNHYDFIIVTTGASAIEISELSDLPLSQVKGQLLELEWPNDLPVPKAPLNSQAYLVMNPNGKSCILGATFERQFKDAKPDLQTAIQEILPKGIAMIPELKKAKILDCRSGIRASTPGHKPYIKKVGSNSLILTGMGSKGLLYHSFYAKKLVNEILSMLN